MLGGTGAALRRLTMTNTESTTTESTTPTLADALEWARVADAGEYLVYYEDTGLTHDEDPGSRCGYDDADLDAIRKVLRDRDLTLSTDDVGLLAEAARS